MLEVVSLIQDPLKQLEILKLPPSGWSEGMGKSINMSSIISKEIEIDLQDKELLDNAFGNYTSRDYQ